MSTQRHKEKNTPGRGGERESEKEKECTHAGERERERVLWLLLLYVFPPSGPALCKLSQPGVLFVLPEVLTPSSPRTFL